MQCEGMQQIILFLYNYTQFNDRFIIILLEMSDNLHVVTVIYTYVQCAYINTLINIYNYRMMTSYIKGSGVQVNGLPALQ